MKKNIIRSAIMPQMILCRMGALESAVGESAAGDGEFNYWKGDDVAGEGGPPGAEEFTPRMAIKKDGDVLTFVMCNGATKAMELVFSTANNTYNGHVIHIWGSEFQGQMDFSADGPPDDFTTASFTNTFVEASLRNVYGAATLEATPEFNTVYGFYNEAGEENNFAGAVYARFDSSQGTARFRQDSGSYPARTVQQSFLECESFEGEGNCGSYEDDWINGWLAECPGPLADGSLICFSMCVDEGEPCCPTLAEGDTCDMTPGEGHIESFAIDVSDPLNLIFTVAATSIYEDAVASATLQDSSAQPDIGFTSASADVDCSASDSWDPIPIPASPPDMSACNALENEMNNWDVGNLCEIQDNIAGGGGQ